MKKRFFRILVLVLVVATVIFSVRWYRDKEEEEAGGNLKIYGTIDIRDASLAFNEQERISEVLVEEGDRVQFGQTLARLKTDRLTALEPRYTMLSRFSSGFRKHPVPVPPVNRTWMTPGHGSWWKLPSSR
jgi:HlyD family secretion protein